MHRAGRSAYGLFPRPYQDQLSALIHEPTFRALVGAALFNKAPAAIADFRARWAKKTNDLRRLQWSDAETLTNAELVLDGQVSYAALILLGTHAALGRHLGQAEVVFEFRAIFSETGPDFSALPCSGATLADLAPRLH